jgi:D-beta-D-heptose 7-phosphate kinase / D-beta-D-heptose 1-phosphate adenosyltransferase
MRKSLVVFGDALLDLDVESTASRLSPEAPVPVLVEQARQYRAGGAALAAALAASDNRLQVSLVAPCADDDAAEQIRRLLPEQVVLIEVPADGKTSVKTRFRVSGQTVARLDDGVEPMSIRHLPKAARGAMREADGIVVSDYGDGATRHEPFRELLAECLQHTPVLWDPHPRGTPPVPGVTMVTPNLAEAESAAQDEAGQGLGRTSRQADLLVRKWAARTVAITLGERGALLADGSGTVSIFPPPSVTSGDACGAGDCFAAATASALTRGALPTEAVASGVESASGFIAAGGVAGGQLAPATPPRSSVGSALELVGGVRRRGGTVVATGGCFDLLHAGHIATLQAARSLGDCLVVCLNSDDSVRRLKGPGRPLQTAEDRALVLRALACVDAVTVFDEDTPSELLRTLRPDVWVKGGDYTGVELPETAYLQEWGARVVTVPYLRGHSTSELMDLARR